MSAVVDVTSQVVMHPVVSHSLKVWGTTLGRDKVGPANPLTTETKELMMLSCVGRLFGSRQYLDVPCNPVLCPLLRVVSRQPRR